MAYTPENPVSIAFTSGGYTPSQPVNFDFSYSSNYLQVTEQSVDTIQITGGAEFIGNLAVVESGSDSFAASGQVIVTGTLSHTEETTDTLTSSGTVLVQGDIAATEQTNDVFLATSVTTSGNLAATESGSDIFAAVGYLESKGDLLVTESGSDIFAATGYREPKGDLLVIETGEDIFAATGYREPTGDMLVTETGEDTLSASGFLAPIVTLGDLLAAETSVDQLTSSGKVLTKGSLSAYEIGNDLFLTTPSGTRVGSMHHLETTRDTIAISGDISQESVPGTLYFVTTHPYDAPGTDLTQIVYTTTLPADSTVVTPPADNASETLAKWYKSTVDKVTDENWHPYDNPIGGGTSYEGGTSQGGLTGLTEAGSDTFFAVGTVPQPAYAKPVILEIRDYVTDLPITSVTVTLAVDGSNYTVSNTTGQAYLGVISSGAHTVVASATGYQATATDTIDNDSFTL